MSAQNLIKDPSFPITNNSSGKECRLQRRGGGFSAQIGHNFSLPDQPQMSTNNPVQNTSSFDAYRGIVILLGAAALSYTLYQMDYSAIEGRYLLFVIITVAFASRIVVKLPKVKGHVSISDSFIFLAIILFGGYPAVLLSTLDAIPGSYKLAKTKITLFFNVAVYTLSTFAVIEVLEFFFPVMPKMSGSDFTAEGLVVLCVMGGVQYIANAALIAVGVALRSGDSLWRTWRDNFVWASLTTMAAASAAGLIAKLIGVFGIYAFLASTPVIAVVYFTYVTYIRNIEAAASQAEAAQKHVEELSHHIAEQERVSRALKESEEYFRNAFDHAAGMAVIDTSGKWMQVNESLCQMLGYTEEEMLRNGFQSITHPSDLGNDIANLQQLLDGKIQNYQLEKRYSHKWGHSLWVLQSASLVRDTGGGPKHVIFQIQNISDKKRAEEKVHHAAFHDTLTGLPNRALFTERLGVAVQRSLARSDYKFAVIFTDLDRFKIVNDSLGHDTGDELLMAFSTRLESCIRQNDTVARLGGDEFAVLIDGIESLDDAKRIADKIQASLSEPFQVEGHQFFTTVSMGIAFSDHGYSRPEEMLRDADTAMYKAKANGKARYEVFDKQMHMRAVRTLTLENELRRALERDEIQPYYQAIVALRTGKIVGFEALARWIHPDRGLISPADFIPLAEENGLIGPVALAVMDNACKQLSLWKHKFQLPDLTISANLSVAQFKKTDVVASVKTALNDAALAPHSLKLEITETVIMEDSGAAIETIKTLKQLGVQISIDDFGTGYSSLSYLHKFPFDVIKIDRSFISRMAVDKESFGIIRTICALAAELGKEVIAEGVERKEHQKMLCDIGCQFGQGYLFSKPVDAETAETLLNIPTPWRDYKFSQASQGSVTVENSEFTYEM